MEKILKYIVAPFLTLVILSMVIYLFFQSILGTSVPDYEGEIEIKGLIDSVEVRTSKEGIPLIISKNKNDLMFTLGYLHARDRLLELEFNKLVAEGRLSEYFGIKMVNIDKYLRQLRFHAQASREIKEINAETMTLLQSYIAGLNFCINSEEVVIQSEFAAAGMTPSVWKVEDVVLLLLLENFREEGKYQISDITGLMKEKLDVVRAAEVFGGAVDSSRVKGYSKIREYLVKEENDIRRKIGLVGNNSFSYKEVSGLKGSFISLSGSYTFPGRYYSVSYDVGGVKGSGITIPGVPFLYLGMKGAEAWLLHTSAMDLRHRTITQFDDKGNIVVNGKIRSKIGIIRDTIRIEGSDPEIIEILTGTAGEVITGKEPGEDVYNSDSTEVLKVYNAESIYVSGFNAAGFLNSALEFWDEEVSTKYFNSDANTEILNKFKSNPLKVITTKTEVKSETHEATAKKKKPSKKKPKPAVVKEKVEENSKADVVDIAKVSEFASSQVDGFFHIAPSISERPWLQKPEGKNIPSYILNDVTSEFSLKMVPLIVNAFSGTSRKDTNLIQSLRVISGWSGEYLSGLQAPLIMAMFFKYFTVNTFGDEFSKEDFEFLFGVGGYPLGRLKELSQEKYAPVFDIRSTSQIEDRDQIIRKSFAEAITAIENKYGNNLIMWLWGKENIFIPRHILSHLMGGISEALALETAGISGFFDTQFTSSVNPFSDLTNGRNYSGWGTLNRFYLDPDRGIFLMIPYLGNSGNFADKMSGITYINFLEGKMIPIAPVASENDKVLRLIKKM